MQAARLIEFEILTARSEVVAASVLLKESGGKGDGVGDADGLAIAERGEQKAGSVGREREETRDRLDGVCYSRQMCQGKAVATFEAPKVNSTGASSFAENNQRAADWRPFKQLRECMGEIKYE